MTEQTPVTIYVTDHALTKGIKERKVTYFENGAWGDREGSHYVWYHTNREGTDWHFNKGGAIEKAEEMRVKKIAALKRQIERLERMTFE